MKKLRAQVTVDHSRCTKCMLCVNLCPMQVFEFSHDRISVSSERCILCYGCIPLCPSKAIAIDVDGGSYDVVEFVKMFERQKTLDAFRSASHHHDARDYQTG